jgi:non-canonical purine NTP pyrophosphatase (RdgB/HAM1 family)
MKIIYFITGNSKKLEEAKKAFDGGDFDIRSVDIGLFEIQTLDQKMISKSKAEQAFNKLNQPIMVDDSGIFFKKYNNFPGALTKHIVEGLGFENLLKLVDKNDEAEFKTVITYKDNEKEISVEGVVGGNLTKLVNDKISFETPFSSVFMVKGIGKLLKDLNNDELKTYSSRGIALSKLRRELEK